MTEEQRDEVKRTVVGLVRDYYARMSVRQMNQVDRRSIAWEMACQLDGPDELEVLDYLEYILPKAYLAALSGWPGDPERRRIDPWLNRHLRQWSFQSDGAVLALAREARPGADTSTLVACSLGERAVGPDRMPPGE